MYELRVQRPFPQTAEDATEPPAEADLPKSSSWVPSYSVSSQGASPLHSPNVQVDELPEESAPAPESVAEVVAAPEPAPEPVESAQVEPELAVHTLAAIAPAPVVKEVADVPAETLQDTAPPAPVVNVEAADEPAAADIPSAIAEEATEAEVGRSIGTRRSIY